MQIGYERVSTDDQTLNSRRATLRLAGREGLYDDRVSNATSARERNRWRKARALA